MHITKEEIQSMPKEVQLRLSLTTYLSEMVDRYFDRGKELEKHGWTSHLPLWGQGPKLFEFASQEVQKEKEKELERVSTAILGVKCKDPEKVKEEKIKRIEERKRLAIDTGKNWLAYESGFRQEIVKMQSQQRALYFKRKRELDELVFAERKKEVENTQHGYYAQYNGVSPSNKLKLYKQVLGDKLGKLGFTLDKKQSRKQRPVFTKETSNNTGWKYRISSETGEMMGSVPARMQANGRLFIGQIKMYYEFGPSDQTDIYSPIIFTPESFFPIANSLHADVYSSIYDSLEELEVSLMAYTDMYTIIHEELELYLEKGVELAKDLNLVNK